MEGFTYCPLVCQLDVPNARLNDEGVVFEACLTASCMPGSLGPPIFNMAMKYEMYLAIAMIASVDTGVSKSFNFVLDSVD